MTSQLAQYSFVADWNDRAVPEPRSSVDYARRALSVWPGLDRARLRRAQNDPMRIGRVVSSGTSLPIETILVLLHSKG